MTSVRQTSSRFHSNRMHCCPGASGFFRRRSSWRFIHIEMLHEASISDGELPAHHRHCLLCEVATDDYLLCKIMDDISSEDLLILKEKARTYRGSFKISLENIELQTTTHNTRQRDPKNIARLLESFALEGCNRLQPENYISVLVDGVELPSQIEHPSSNYNEPPTLTLQGTVLCLDGHHRIQAAREFLAGEDRWWVADLYLNGIAVLLLSD